MTALRGVQLVVSLSFLALGIFTVVDWARHRDRNRGYLALALGTLGLTSILGQIDTLTSHAAYTAVSDASLVLLMVSGYSLLLFRHSFIPLAREIRVGAAVACAAVLIAYLVIGPATSSSGRVTAPQSAAVIALVLVWSACVLEPVIRFWLASRSRPAVQRARLRALGGGYGAIVVILVIAGFGGRTASSTAVSWLFEIIAILALPLLLVAFAPPIWLRRIWRQAELERLRDAIHELVLFSPDRKTLAKRAVDWAARLVGADGAAIFDTDGSLMAATGVGTEIAGQLASRVEKAPKLMASPGSQREDAIVVPLALDAGTASMVVISGPFTPFFGSDEVSQLSAYTVNIVAALDRARVTERLAALDRMKSQFLNLASHELRSPLAVIGGYLSMLEQGSFGQLKEQGVRAIEVLKAKTLEMNLLVTQMLDAARLEEGKLELRQDHLDLRQVAREALEIIRPMTDSEHQLLLEEPPTEVPILGDSSRLLTIVTNLLENAIKYSPDGGPVECAVASKDATATISVRDRGVGMGSDDLLRLFNRFERLRNPLTNHVGGTGLGLYLSRELARQHGGDINVVSEPGQGSTFTLTMPLTQATPTEPPIAVADQAIEGERSVAGSRLRVFAADGEESRSA